MCFSPQRRAIFQYLNFKKWSEHVSLLAFSLENVLLATAACNFSTSQLQKVVRSWCVLYIVTWKCASRHSGVQFFNISTSKSGPELMCFVHFHFKMCFSPQRRAIFQHLNFKKWSGADVFCTFSLQNVLLATAACNFSTSQLQKVVRSWCVLYIFTSKCASRHSGVQFFNISTSKSGPELMRFVHFHFKMCFSPQRRAIFQHLNFKKWSGADVFCTFSLQNVLLATAACNFWFLLWPHDSAPAALTSLLFDSPDTRIIGKTQRFATSLTFGADASSFFWLSRYCIFFLLTLLHLLTLLSSDFTSSICFSSAFQLSILSEVYYLNFLRLNMYLYILN